MINFTAKTPIYMSGGGFMGDYSLVRIFQIMGYEEKQEHLHIKGKFTFSFT